MAAGTFSSPSSLPPLPRHDGGGLLSLLGTSRHGCSDGDPHGDSAGTKVDQDFIRELPDEIICEIFSYLTMDEIVRTSILSRRWRYVWTKTWTIAFSHVDSLCTPGIDRVLTLCTATAIQKFHISLIYVPSIKGRINRYVSFAVARGVKDLELNFSSKVVFGEPREYVLPGILLSCRSVERLRLGYCSLKAVSNDGVNWRSLKALCVHNTEMEGRLLDMILEGSPALERLELKYCFDTRRITILSTRIRELVIDGHGFRTDVIEGDPALEIYAPYLPSLRILGDISDVISINLSEVSSLVDTELNFLGLDSVNDDVFDDFREMVEELLMQLGRVRKLEIGRYVLPILHMIEVNEGCKLGSCCLDLACRQLTLKMISHAGIKDFFGIVAVLRCTPEIKKLIISLLPDRSSSMDDNELSLEWFQTEYSLVFFRGDPFAKPNWTTSDCMAKHLRSIEIFGGCDADVTTTDWETWLPLVEFLLRESLVLEEMTIHIDTHGLNSFSEEILSYIRGSDTARVVFVHPGGSTTLPWGP